MVADADAGDWEEDLVGVNADVKLAEGIECDCGCGCGWELGWEELVLLLDGVLEAAGWRRGGMMGDRSKGVIGGEMSELR